VLGITIKKDEDVDTVFSCFSQNGLDAGTVTLVLFVLDYYSPSQSGDFGCLVGAAIIDDNGLIHILSGLKHHSADVLFFVEGWDSGNYLRFSPLGRLRRLVHSFIILQTGLLEEVLQFMDI